jgi:DnaJ-domain-containing protein 1
VTIGKRLIDLVRSNVASLFDRPSGGNSLGSTSSPHIEDLSDGDLEQELERRRRRREAVNRAADRAIFDEAWEEVEGVVRDGPSRFRSSSGRAGHFRRTGSNPGVASGSSRRTGDGMPRRDLHMAQLYAQLECPYGADLNTVRKQYRSLMLKYHPDMHSRNAEKQRLATELSQRLTAAYNELRRSLSGI